MMVEKRRPYQNIKTMGQRTISRKQKKMDFSQKSQGTQTCRI